VEVTTNLLDDEMTDDERRVTLTALAACRAEEDNTSGRPN
jgi:hypothetical protein